MHQWEKKTLSDVTLTHSLWHKTTTPSEPMELYSIRQLIQCSRWRSGCSLKLLSEQKTQRESSRDVFSFSNSLLTNSLKDSLIPFWHLYQYWSIVGKSRHTGPDSQLLLQFCASVSPLLSVALHRHKMTVTQCRISPTILSVYTYKQLYQFIVIINKI